MLAFNKGVIMVDVERNILEEYREAVAAHRIYNFDITRIEELEFHLEVRETGEEQLVTFEYLDELRDDHRVILLNGIATEYGVNFVMPEGKAWTLRSFGFAPREEG